MALKVWTKKHSLMPASICINRMSFLDVNLKSTSVFLHIKYFLKPTPSEKTAHYKEVVSKPITNTLEECHLTFENGAIISSICKIEKLKLSSFYWTLSPNPDHLDLLQDTLGKVFGRGNKINAPLSSYVEISTLEPLPGQRTAFIVTYNITHAIPAYYGLVLNMDWPNLPKIKQELLPDILST